jgi:hypothetical protein
MIHAAISLAVGVAAYLIVVAFQPRSTRASSEVWRDWAGISAVCALALVGLLFWSAMDGGPGSSGASIIANLFNQPSARRVWIPYAGFASLAFSCCAALHVATLWVASRAVARLMPNTSLERTRER